MQLTDVQTDYKVLDVSSKAFSHEETIPRRHTCDGLNVSPPLDIGEIPQEAKSLALIVEDPDAPGGTWLHWLVWNIPVKHHIAESEVPGVLGTNDFRHTSYGGPCPPPGTGRNGTHRYFFKVYALDNLPDLPAGSSKKQLEAAMGNHIVAYGELMGIYKRVRHL